MMPSSSAANVPQEFLHFSLDATTSPLVPTVLRGNRSSPAPRVWGNTPGTTSTESTITPPVRSGQDAERRKRHSHAERGNEGNSSSEWI